MRLAVGSILVVIFSTCVAAQTPSRLPENDDQFWNETQVIVWSDEKNEISLSGGFRVGREFSHFVDGRGGIFYAYKFSKRLTFSGGYLYRGNFPTKNRKSYENRAVGSLTFNLPLRNKFKLVDRNQFEYRAINSRPDLKIYRNRLRIEREIRIKDTKITPFGFIEIFYNTGNAWYRARYAAGISRKFSEKFTGEIFYLRQADGITRPGNLNVLATTLKIHL